MHLHISCGRRRLCALAGIIALALTCLLCAPAAALAEEGNSPSPGSSIAPAAQDGGPAATSIEDSGQEAASSQPANTRPAGIPEGEVVVASGLTATGDEGYTHISGQEAQELIEIGNCTIVDVRGEVGWSLGHIPGAIPVNFDEAVAGVEAIQPDKSATIVVYCDYGGVSKMAAEDLVAAGYASVVEFDGMEVWEGEVVEGDADAESANRFTFKPEHLTGLLMGLLFGIFLKRSHLCFTALWRDVYLERRPYNLALIAAIIGIQGLIYFALANAGLVRLPQMLPPFSLLAIAVGSLVFGIGAVLASGCLVGNLVKAGDGRLAGLAALGAFFVTGYLVSAGPLQDVSAQLRSVAIVQDDLALRHTVAPLVLFGIMAAVAVVLLVRHRRSAKKPFDIPGRFTGTAHKLLERTWTPEVAVVCIGVLAGLAFLVSGQIGRHFGISVATPLLSWAYAITGPAKIVGGCNPFDTMLGWGSLFVLGILLGSLVASLLAGEFHVVKPTANTLVRAIVGGALMGIGAMWGSGCLTSNGFVGTAQLSLKSWYALVFLVAGIWLAAKVLYKRKG